MSNWRDEARDDAADMVREFMDDIVERLCENNEADTYYSDYSDSYHHETHVDKSYNASEAVELLEDLDEYEETDRGLWDGLNGWRDQLSCVAAYTYGNAVASFFTDLVGEINQDDDLMELCDQWTTATGREEKDEKAEDEAGKQLTPDQITRKMRARIEVICNNF